LFSLSIMRVFFRRMAVMAVMAVIAKT